MSSGAAGSSRAAVRRRLRRGPLWVMSVRSYWGRRSACVRSPPKPDKCVLMAEKFQQSKMNNAKASCMRDGVGAPDRIELVDQRTYMELGRVDGDAETSSDRLIRHPLGQ